MLDLLEYRICDCNGADVSKSGQMRRATWWKLRINKNKEKAYCTVACQWWAESPPNMTGGSCAELSIANWSSNCRQAYLLNLLFLGHTSHTLCCVAFIQCLLGASGSPINGYKNKKNIRMIQKLIHTNIKEHMDAYVTFRRRQDWPPPPARSRAEKTMMRGLNPAYRMCRRR